jgi:hypothetical protein
MQVLQRVDVGHEASEQVAPPVAAQVRGRERLDPLIHAPARPAERAQSNVVRAQPFQVSGHRADETEETHGHDRDRQREDRGPLRCAGDQVPGGGHQPDAEDYGQCPEQDGEGNAAAWHTGQLEQAAEGGHADSLVGTKGLASASSEMIRSAR